MRWQTTLDGSIASHPVLSDGALFVPSFDRQLHALAAESGDELWTADAENWVWGSPALGDGMVYFGDIDGNIYAVSAQTGEPQWSATANGAIQSSLLYDEGVVYVTSGQTDGDEEERTGELLALDAQDGSMLWQRETDAPVFSAPVLVGDEVVIVYLDGQAPILNVFDREDGSVTWEFTLPTES
jgi:outer membrane protein assembly factor BamB